MNIKELFPRKYANGSDLNGKPYTFTVRTVQLESIQLPGKPAENKPVIYFQEAHRGIILTRALAEQVAEILASPDTDNWQGRKVTIFPLPMRVAGVDRIAIRARAAANGPSIPPAELQDDDPDA
jgi:hypothetical protein